MEASALPAQVGLARTRVAIGGPLLRLRSDEQLVSLFRDGHDDAFRVIHDRYRTRLVAYTRQMLAGSPADPEDAVQEIFVRAYAGLRVDARELALRPWLYRVAHNRCIDELRRPQSMASSCLPETMATTLGDPVAHVEQRDALRRLIIDVSRLPEQQRSALLMRELGGMTYVDLAAALGMTVPAVKSILVRARVSLAAASQARDATCAEIQGDLVLAHDRGVRCSGLARRHLRDCEPCREFRAGLRSTSRQLAALVPLGPIGAIASLLGIGGGGSGAAAGGGAAATGSVGGIGSGAGASLGLGGAGVAAGAGHVATLLAAAVVTAGGAIELQQHIVPHVAPLIAHHGTVGRRTGLAVGHPLIVASAAEVAAVAAVAAPGGSPLPRTAAGTTSAGAPPAPAAPVSVSPVSVGRRGRVSSTLPLTELLDPDHLAYNLIDPAGTGTTGPTGSSATSGAGLSAVPGAGGAGGAGGSGASGGSTTATGTAGSTGSSGGVTAGSSSSATSAGASSASGSSAPGVSSPAPSGSLPVPGASATSSGGSGQTAGSGPAGTTGGASAGGTAAGAGSSSPGSGGTSTSGRPATASSTRSSSTRASSTRHTPGATFVVTGRS